MDQTANTKTKAPSPITCRGQAFRTAPFRWCTQHLCLTTHPLITTVKDASSLYLDPESESTGPILYFHTSHRDDLMLTANAPTFICFLIYSGPTFICQATVWHSIMTYEAFLYVKLEHLPKV